MEANQILHSAGEQTEIIEENVLNFLAWHWKRDRNGHYNVYEHTVAVLLN